MDFCKTDSTKTAELKGVDIIDVQPRNEPRACLIVYGDNQPPQIHIFTKKDRKRLGRAEEMDIQVNDPEVSRHHAEFIFNSNGQLSLEDLNSHNGTWVKGERINLCYLYRGDVVQMGGVRAVVDIMDERADEVRPPAEVSIPGAPQLVVLNPKMRAIYKQVAEAASYDAPVLILGETGTGKEHVAQALHALGNRFDKPFKVINCGAVPQELTESIVFGHERGAFTNAVRKAIGLFEQANKGVLFLDEIGELPISAQASLLRAVETKKVTPLGSAREIAVDVRIIAATHCWVEKMVEEGSFRKDLLYRLNTVTIEIPPLRERLEEIEPLAELFLEQTRRAWKTEVKSIHPAVIDRFRVYDWPGNIRQLRNVVERSILASSTERIELGDLPDFLLESATKENAAVSIEPPQSPDRDSTLSYKEQLRLWEARVISQAMARTDGNQAAAARLLRMPLRTFFYKIKSHGLSQEQRQT